MDEDAVFDFGRFIDTHENRYDPDIDVEDDEYPDADDYREE